MKNLGSYMSLLCTECRSNLTRRGSTCIERSENIPSAARAELALSEAKNLIEIASPSARNDFVGLLRTLRVLAMTWDEKGTALIVAMIFLGLLTTIGLFAIFNSTTELTGSARYKSNKEAFYAAEGAIEYVKGDGYYFTTRTTMDFPDNAHPTAAARNLSAEGTTATGSITYISSGNPPPGYGFSAKDTSASYFVIEATGSSPAGIQSVQEEGVAKVLPKS